MGVIFYISAVNDEVAHRKKPPPNAKKDQTFHYHYGWGLLCIILTQWIGVQGMDANHFIQYLGSLMQKNPNYFPQMDKFWVN